MMPGGGTHVPSSQLTSVKIMRAAGAAPASAEKRAASSGWTDAGSGAPAAVPHTCVPWPPTESTPSMTAKYAATLRCAESGSGL